MNIDFLRDKKVLFVFGDAAGAKSLLAIVQNLKLSNSTFYLFSDRYHSFYQNFNLIVNIEELNVVYDFIKKESPEIIFTGTSLPGKFEVNILRYAIGNKINCFSFIDHWVNFKERFTSDGELYLPNKIFVIDQRAIDLAIAEGVPREKLFLFKSPYQEWLKNWNPNQGRAELLAMLGLGADIRFILYAPEPIQKYGLSSKYGFDEFQILEEIIAVFQANLHAGGRIPNTMLVYKVHPNCSIEETNFLLSSMSLLDFPILKLTDLDFNSLAFYSSGVLGFFSNSIVEASILGVPTFRLLHRMVENCEDPLMHLDVGIKIDKNKALVELINSLFYDDFS